MFDEPEESPNEQARDAAGRAKEKADEFRMHAEFAACYEAIRKFDAEIRVDLPVELARDLQKALMKLERARIAETPVLPAESIEEAKRVLNIPQNKQLTTNDYHIHRRPGETIMVRWLAGDEVEQFYERMQAHLEAALNHYREEERQANEWKADSATLAYLDALDAVKINMAERYLRKPIREQNLYVLSTQSADELDILHLCDYVMGVEAARVVGQASAPPEAPTESDRAWYFKLFSLRGNIDGIEKMCFFTYLQKTGDEF
ncbi:MAG TPA: hypothetical protein VGG19_14135 [Tepidisphaeraceae bacterium]|jgi:hypothetical protein